MLLLIDNYDSFTYNLFHYLGELGEDVVVRRNDQISAADALAMYRLSSNFLCLGRIRPRSLISYFPLE